MKKTRMIIDILMVILLPVLMAYSLVGELFHEIAGIVMAGLFIAHNLINRRWWMSLFKGRYNPNRIFRTVINVLLLIFMILQPLSGLLMSKYILKGVTMNISSTILRSIHLVLAYWGFVMMSLHLGLHGNMIVQKGKKTVRYVLILAATYGLYAFIKRKLIEYMFMINMFVYFDYSEPIAFFIFDYLSIMILFAVIGYNINECLTAGRQK